MAVFHWGARIEAPYLYLPIIDLLMQRAFGAEWYLRDVDFLLNSNEFQNIEPGSIEKIDEIIPKLIWAKAMHPDAEHSRFYNDWEVFQAGIARYYGKPIPEDGDSDIFDILRILTELFVWGVFPDSLPLSVFMQRDIPKVAQYTTIQTNNYFDGSTIEYIVAKLRLHGIAYPFTFFPRHLKTFIAKTLTKEEKDRISKDLRNRSSSYYTIEDITHNFVYNILKEFNQMTQSYNFRKREII